MSRSVLTIRINRRAVGAVILDNESLTFIDGRHLTSRSDRTVDAAIRFVEYVLAITKPVLLVLDAPRSKADSTTTRITNALADVITGTGLELLPVSKSEILAAYGIRGVRSRRELRELIRQYWPELTAMRRKVEPYVTDAAAAALYADCRVSLERVAT